MKLSKNLGLWLALHLFLLGVAAGQSDIVTVGGQTVQRPLYPLYEAKIFGSLPGMGIGTGPNGSLIPTRSGSVTAARVLNSFGDSITAGVYLASSTQAYPQVIANQLGLVVNNQGISGDQACDIFPRQIVAYGLSNSTLEGGALSTVMIGTNDANVKGVGSYEKTFMACHQALLAWLLTPREAMVLPGDAALVGTGSWSASSSIVYTASNYGSLKGAYASGAGTLTATLTTYGNPIYVWYMINDQTSASSNFSLTVDGVACGVYNTNQPTAIATQNGTFGSAALIRIPAAAGTHTVVATATVAGAAILGFGTIPSNSYAGRPVVLSGNITNQAQGNFAYALSTWTQYNADISADEAILQADNADLRHAPNNTYMLGTAAEMHDQVHPNQLGAQHVASAFLQALQLTPTGVGYDNWQGCSAACTVLPSVSVVYEVGNTGPVTLPTLPVLNLTPTIGFGQRVTVVCVAQPSGCTVAVPTGYVLMTTSGLVLNGTLSLANYKSATFSSYAVPTGPQWMLIGNN